MNIEQYTFWLFGLSLSEHEHKQITNYYGEVTIGQYASSRRQSKKQTYSVVTSQLADWDLN